MENRVIVFDIVRAFAILLILFHHLPQHSFDFHVFSLKGHLLDLTFLYGWESYLGLGLFVFISGYLLTMTNPSFERWRDIKQFVLKRVLRIFPLYMVALVLFIALSGEIRSSLNICTFLLNLLGLQIIFASKDCSPLLTLWFVGLILSYYYLFIILVKFGGGIRRLIASAGVIFLLSGLLIQRMGWMDERFLFYLPLFVAGILGARYQLIEKMKFSHALLISLLFIIFVGFHTAFVSPREIPRFLSFIGLTNFVLHNLIVLCIVFVVFAFAKAILRAGCHGFLQRIAYASYGMYLFHRPIWWLMEDVYSPANVEMKAVYLALFGIPLTIVVSYYVQRVYDGYFQRGLIAKG
jgi:peptidoglycan/LPS O-acetylase OafA/YrhL